MPASPSHPTSASPTLIRHIVPVLLGGIVALLLTVVTDSMMAAHGMLPSDGGPMFDTGTLLLITAYRAVFATLGCHLASRLAPPGNPRIRYALALGTVLLALNVVGAVMRAGQVPVWYSICAIALTFPCAIIGGATAVRVLARGQRSG
jgi:hypothetical protein